MKLFLFIQSIVFLFQVHTLAGDRPLVQPAQSSLFKKTYLNNAIEARITKKGQTVFYDRMDEILSNIGVDLTEGSFPSQSSEIGVDFDTLEKTNPEAVQAYKQLKAFLEQWLVGFALNPHRVAIDIGDSGYSATFEKFGIFTDQSLLESLNKNDGAVLVVEMRISRINFMTNAVKFWDMNNDFLGQLSLQDVNLQGQSTEKPLLLRLPFYIRLNENKSLEFTALGFEQNLEQFPLALNYKKLIMPEFAIQINGKRFPVNAAELNKLINSKQEMILQKIRENISSFATQQLPKVLNQKAKESLAGNLEQIQDMTPPGKPSSRAKDTDYKWGLKLSGLAQKQSIKLALDAYVEDPSAKVSTPILSSSTSRSKVNFDLLSEDQYDVAISLDRGLVNRAVQLSFERKYLTDMNLNDQGGANTSGSGSCVAKKKDDKDDGIISLVKPPTIDYVKNIKSSDPKETFVRLSLSVKKKTNALPWLARQALDNFVVVDFDIIAKIKEIPTAGEGLFVVLHSIDSDSIFMDDKYLSSIGSLLKSRVKSELRSALLDLSSCWKNSDYLQSALSFPPQILGLKLKTKKIDMDATGHLVLYTDYAN
ncbi:MAG: hypothetical protein ACOYOK_08220 [Pseudobdellovibrionaceae bacterium]